MIIYKGKAMNITVCNFFYVAYYNTSSYHGIGKLHEQ